MRWFDPKDGDHCYIKIDPHVNEWVKGTIVTQVIGVPNSFVANVDGHKYRQNKRDTTLTPLTPPKPSNGDSDESGSDDHQDEHRQQMRCSEAHSLSETNHKVPSIASTGHEPERLSIVNF